MTDAQTITRALGGQWHRHYGRACCPACNNANLKNPALSIKGGLGGNLLLWCFKGCTFTEILDALKSEGLTDGWTGDFKRPSAEDVRRHRAEQDAEAVKRANQARLCWEETQPIGGSLAETYLRGRDITCDLPESLRFHPACFHGPTAKRFPAMVARIDGAKHFAIHRTFLRPDGTKHEKLMLGSTRGGAVRLSDGAGPLVVAEGIETALSLSCGLLDRCGRVWATLSTAGMTALTLPPAPGELIVASDGDAPGRAAAIELAGRASRLGWQVSTTDPGDGRDFNDLLQCGAAA